MILFINKKRVKIFFILTLIVLTLLLIINIQFFAIAVEEESFDINSVEEIIKTPDEASTSTQDILAFRSTNILDSIVQNMEGEELGTIEDLIIDMEDGRILFGVLSCCGFLGFGTELYAIPWNNFIPKPIPGIFILDVTQEILEKAPGFPLEEWPVIGDREWGAGIYQYYGHSSRAYPSAGYGYWFREESGGWGISTPYGQIFNTETIISFETEVIRIDRFIPFKGMTEGVELVVKLNGKQASVHLAPAWYLEYKNFNVEEGDKIKVSGSHIDFNGIPAIIATKIVGDDDILNLRDEMGFPVWSAVPSDKNFVVEDEDTILIQELLFIPVFVRVKAGTTVTWINQDTTTHTVTSGIAGEDKTGEIFDSLELKPNENFSYIFENPGEFPYFCKLHSNMAGRITVYE